MSWDNILMIFVDILVESNINHDDFYVTRADLLKYTDQSPCSISNNLSVLVKRGWLRREETITNTGREVRYYINNDEIVNFVNKFLR